MRTDFYEIWLLNSMVYWVLLWQSGQTNCSCFKLYQICILWMTIKYMKLCQMLNQYSSQEWPQAPCIATWTSNQQIDQKWPICKLKFWYKKRILTWIAVHKTQCVPDLMIGRVQGQPLFQGLCWLCSHTPSILNLETKTLLVQAEAKVMPQLGTVRQQL